MINLDSAEALMLFSQTSWNKYLACLAVPDKPCEVLAYKLPETLWNLPVWLKPFVENQFICFLKHDDEPPNIRHDNIKLFKSRDIFLNELYLENPLIKIEKAAIAVNNEIVPVYVGDWIVLDKGSIYPIPNYLFKALYNLPEGL